MIELQTLGGLDLRDAKGHELHVVLRQPKRFALLAYLAVATPRGFHRRDTLLGLFWPELDQEHARNALNQAVHVLRDSLGREVITSRGEELGLASRAITCDVNEETTEIARRYAQEAGVAARIDYRLGPALETIAGLEGEFDLVFIDADKPNYLNYYEATLPRLARRGLIVLDNTLWSGRVADPDENDENVQAIRTINRRVLEDPRVDNVLLTVRDGMNLVWLR